MRYTEVKYKEIIDEAPLSESDKQLCRAACEGSADDTVNTDKCESPLAIRLIDQIERDKWYYRKGIEDDREDDYDEDE